MLGLTSSAAGRGSQITKYEVVNLKQTTIPPSPSSVLYPPGGSGESAHTSILNVRSLLDNPRSYRPERRTALIAREMVCYKQPPGNLNTLLPNLPARCFDFSNQITEKLYNLHAPDNNGTVETQWCQLRNVIQSTTLEVLDNNDAGVSNLLAEKNGLHKDYMDLWTDATKAAFFRCRRLVQQGLREMQDAWMIRKAE
ncbi:unnamed protein product [Schistocephalus solidus]|uniref:Uncharacterized protein n=1 Tax=Schistocephalus solidus TaxID=70667 RepID=A0A183TGU7_SCHSO|nr:unnamed protein product [Schistocephalus solidus]